MNTQITEKIESKVAELIGNVNASLGSMFTKEDVKLIICSLQLHVNEVLSEQTNIAPKQFDFAAIQNEIRERIDSVLQDHNWNDSVSIEDTQFSIDYGNQIILDEYQVSVSHRDVREEIFDELSDYFSDL